MSTTCIVCGGVTCTVAFREFDVDILRCTGCGHVFSSYDAGQDYDGYFGADPVPSGDQFWWNEAHDRMHRDFCDKFLAGRRGTLLDVGCGLGFFVKRVCAIPSWEAVGFEMSSQAVDFARATLGLSNVRCGRVEDSGFARNSFDIITLWDVIEHIPNPDRLLSYLSSVLAEEGMLFMHTPNAGVQVPKARLKKFFLGMRPDVHYLEARDHIHIYSPRGIARILRRNGFRTVTFVHLRPIQGISGSRNRFVRVFKNLWYCVSVAVFHLTLGRVNLDNLFVVAAR